MTHNEKIDMAISYIDEEIMDIENDLSYVEDNFNLDAHEKNKRAIERMGQQLEALQYAIKVLDGAKDKP